MSKLSIVIVGGGVGGLTAALALRKLGHDALVLEQASQFTRVGADINLTPNAVRALDGLGIGDAIRATAARPTYRISRTWDTGEETSRLPMGDEAEKLYGAPQLTIHRADILKALTDALPADCIRFGQRVQAIDTSANGPSLTMANGEIIKADVIIGADGIHSVVRAALFGPDKPEFTGLIAFRAVVPQSSLSVPNLDAFTKWWGPTPDRQIVTFPLNQGRETFVFATKEQDWKHESWTTDGDPEELRATYADFYPEAQALLAPVSDVKKSALNVRNPMKSWSLGAVVLLGDACHPMMPFMAQGAGMAIEDAVVLARALSELPVAQAVAAYEAARLDRTAKVQIGSRGNEWLRTDGNVDWLYGYNAWTAPLDA